MIVRRAGDFDLAARVGAERAVEIDGHGPDRGTLGDGVIEASGAQAQAPHAPLGLRKAPGRRILAVEGRALDVGLRAVVGNGGEPCGGPSGLAMVERIEQGAGRIEAMNEAGVEIGDEELARGGVEYDVAKSGAAVAGDRGEERNRAGLAVDFPDRAGLPPLSGRTGRPSIPRWDGRSFTRSGRPSPSESGSTICRPKAEVAPR